MPIYEFECKKCGETFEILVGFNEPLKQRCLKCGSKDTRRLLSVFSSGSAKGGVTCGPTGTT